MNCFNCNKKMTKKMEIYHYTESGLSNVYLETPVFRCNKCKEIIADIPGMNQLQEIIGIDLVKQDSMLAGNEIKFLRKQLCLKAKELSLILGVTKQTLSRWEHDKENTSKHNDRLIRMVYIQLLQEKCKKVFPDILKIIKAINPVIKKTRIDISQAKLRDVCSISSSIAM